jgi:hypothetical protein
MTELATLARLLKRRHDRRLCAIPYCDEQPYAKGFCERHYNIQRRYGDPEGGPRYCRTPRYNGWRERRRMGTVACEFCAHRFQRGPGITAHQRACRNRWPRAWEALDHLAVADELGIPEDNEDRRRWQHRYDVYYEAMVNQYEDRLYRDPAFAMNERMRYEPRLGQAWTATTANVFNNYSTPTTMDWGTYTATGTSTTINYTLQGNATRDYYIRNSRPTYVTPPRRSPIECTIRFIRPPDLTVSMMPADETEIVAMDLPDIHTLSVSVRRDALTNREIWSAWVSDRVEEGVFSSWINDEVIRNAYHPQQVIDHAWKVWAEQVESRFELPRNIVPSRETVTGEARRDDPAEMERRRQASEAAAERRREAEARKKEAEERARELLLSVLDDENKERYEKSSHIIVKGRSGKSYKIKCGRVHNIYELDQHGREVMQYCVHVINPVPNHDNVLAQKLLIETDEDHFQRLANKTPVRHASIAI